MKITIYTTTDTLDSNATCTPEQAVTSLNSYCAEVSREIAKLYPDAEVEHVESDYCGSCIRVTGADLPLQSEVEDDVQRIVESVYETGNFWA